MVHETQLNRWESRKTLIRRIQGEPLLRSDPKQWFYLWEQTDLCCTCRLDLSPSQPMSRCFSCSSLVHFGCLVENSVSQKIPVCQTCASGSEELPEEQPGDRAPVRDMEHSGEDSKPPEYEGVIGRIT